MINMLTKSIWKENDKRGGCSIKKAYRICYRENRIEDMLSDEWADVVPEGIDNFPWLKSYTPQTEVRMYYTDTDFHVRFQAYETEIRAQYTKMNDPVYKDSCVEFFVNPDPDKDARYMNFEINPLGTMLVGMGTRRNDRVLVDLRKEEGVAVCSSLHRDRISEYEGSCWTIELILSFAFFRKYYGEIPFQSEWRLKGNFYKCGDESPYPHFGCWNRIEAEHPDFHRPEFFGDILMVG